MRERDNARGEQGACEGTRHWRGFSPACISALRNEAVLEAHVGDAAFLWTQRDRAVTAPHFRLPDLVRWDERLEAHLDGLRTAGDRGWELGVQALELTGPGEVFTAGVLALGGAEHQRFEQVLEVALAEPTWERALVSALGWERFAVSGPTLRRLWRSPEPAIQRVGLAGCAIHRLSPGDGWERILDSPDERLRVRALRAAGELGATALLPRLQAACSESGEAIRHAAAWSAARLGLRSAGLLDVLSRAALVPGPGARRALELVVRCMPMARAREWCEQLLAEPKHRRSGLIAVGALGDPALVEKVLTYLDERESARVAGEAFSSLTGVDLAYADLDMKAPEATTTS